jgi:hypothetical protein
MEVWQKLAASASDFFDSDKSDISGFSSLIEY